METSRVAVRKVGSDPVQAVREVLDCFDDAKSKLSECGTVFIKINAVWHHPHLFTIAIHHRGRGQGDPGARHRQEDIHHG